MSRNGGRLGPTASPASGGVWSLFDQYQKNRDSQWKPPGTIDNPASSVAQLYSAGLRADGYYYITLNSVATQVYCSLSGTEGWALAMRMNDGSSNFHYGNAYWTNTSSLNATGDITTAIDIKNNPVFQYHNLTSIRLTASKTATSYTANPLIFNGFTSTTLHSLFNGSNNQHSSIVTKTRSEWLTWFTAVTGTSASVFDNQPNCNTGGINADYTYAKARIGITFNNENDCASNDAAVGFGAYGGSGGSNASAGGATWNPNNSYSTHGWVWVR